MPPWRNGTRSRDGLGARLGPGDEPAESHDGSDDRDASGSAQEGLDDGLPIAGQVVRHGSREPDQNGTAGDRRAYGEAPPDLGALGHGGRRRGRQEQGRAGEGHRDRHSRHHEGDRDQGRTDPDDEAEHVAPVVAASRQPVYQQPDEQGVPPQCPQRRRDEPGAGQAHEHRGRRRGGVRRDAGERVCAAVHLGADPLTPDRLAAACQRGGRRQRHRAGGCGVADAQGPVLARLEPVGLAQHRFGQGDQLALEQLGVQPGGDAGRDEREGPRQGVVVVEDLELGAESLGLLVPGLEQLS